FGRGAKILLTGPPGIGKSTLMRSVLQKLQCPIGGVLCLERRKEGRRIGFDAVLPSGEQELFMFKRAASTPPSPDDKMIGKYVVAVNTIDNFVVPELQRCLTGMPGLVYIDEIGKAQAYSALFFETVQQLFETDRNILATVVEADTPWSLEYKYSPKSWLVAVTVENRDELSAVIIAILNNYSEFESLTDTQQEKCKSLFFNLLLFGKFSSARKLFSNAVLYVAQSKIRCICTDETEALYEVTGSTAVHRVRRNLKEGIFTCDCDLSKGCGSFGHLPAGQTCSHELSILISEC
ncbi:unnamed protein product, partial [Ectocarpus fasciculatus]